MIMIGFLDKHASSPLKIYNNPMELAKRADLYTGNNFYFGFESSNHTFLDIIGERRPLAIKHGPILSLYHHTMNGKECSTYYIDAANRSLHLILEIQATPTAAFTLQNLIPWSFVDAYSPATEALSSPFHQKARELCAEEKIQLMLEQLATSHWPDNVSAVLLNELANDILSREKNLKIKWGELSQIKQKMLVKHKDPSSNDIVAAYNPFYDSISVDINFILAQNPSHITVRQVNDSDPRIEILSPNLPKKEQYKAIYKESSLKLYQSFQNSLNDSEYITALLKENFNDLVNQFLTTHSIENSEHNQAMNSLKY